MSKANNIASLLNSSGLLDSDDIATNAITNSKIASDAITAAKLNIGQVGGRRNLIINGAMQVWQRGTSGFGHNEFSADRWREDTNSSDSLAVSLFEIPSGGQTGLPTMFTHTMKCAVTASSGGGLNDLRQRIEYPKRFMGQTVTLSYYIKASSACSITLRRLVFTSVTNAPSANYLPNLNVTTSWQRVVDTVTLNSSSSAVFSSNSFLDVVLSLPVNQTADVYITGVQLELGETATPFEHRSYGEELSLCYRYYQTYPSSSAQTPMFTGTGLSTTQVRTLVTPFGGLMRDVPAITLPTTTNLRGDGSTLAVTSVDTGSLLGAGYSFVFNAASGLKNGHVYYVTGATGSDALELSAEL